MIHVNGCGGGGGKAGGDSASWILLESGIILVGFQPVGSF